MTATKTTAIALTGDETKALVAIKEISEGHLGDSLMHLEGFERMMYTGKIMGAIRKAMDPLVPTIMQNAGHPLFFQMDKPSYPAEVVRDCLVEAFIHGVQPYNNEFNIISGRCYITLNGMKRKVRSFPGLTDLEIDMGVPTMKGDTGAVVECKVRWKIDGAERELERTIPVRVNKGMGVDAVLGKAHRKILAVLWDRLTGSRMSIPEGEVGDDDLIVDDEPQKKKSVEEQAADALSITYDE